MMGCCDKTDIVREDFEVELHGLTFMVTITFCKSCGSKKYTSGISDGKRKSK